MVGSRRDSGRLAAAEADVLQHDAVGGEAFHQAARSFCAGLGDGRARIEQR